MTAKQERAQACNRLLEAIAGCGRGFFKSKSIARFELRSGRVFLIDDYTGRAIYTHNPLRWNGFSHGGTMRDLVIHLREFIRTGSTLAPSIFGPWPDWLCGGDLWGYRDDMVKVRVAAVELGIVAFAHDVHRIEYTQPGKAPAGSNNGAIT